MGVQRNITCTQANEIELTAVGLELNGSQQVTVVDARACCGACAANKKCYGAELYGTACYLKTAWLPLLPQTPPPGVPLIACIKKNTTTAAATAAAAALPADTPAAARNGARGHGRREGGLPATVFPVPGGGPCGRFSSPGPPRWRECIDKGMVNDPEYVPSGMHCGCSHAPPPANTTPTTGTFHFKLHATTTAAAAAAAAKATEWTCSLVDPATAKETVVGRLSVASPSDKCTPVIIANTTLLRMATAAGGYYAAATWRDVSVSLSKSTSPTTVLPAVPSPGAAPGAACHRIGIYRNESWAQATGACKKELETKRVRVKFFGVRQLTLHVLRPRMGVQRTCR